MGPCPANAPLHSQGHAAAVKQTGERVADKGSCSGMLTDRYACPQTCAHAACLPLAYPHKCMLQQDAIIESVCCLPGWGGFLAHYTALLPVEQYFTRMTCYAVLRCILLLCVNQVLHFIQLYLTGRCQLFDYGSEAANVAAYQQRTPPVVSDAFHMLRCAQY